MTFKETLLKAKEVGIIPRQLDIAFLVKEVINLNQNDTRYERVCKYIESAFYGWADKTKSVYQLCLKFNAFLEDGYTIEEVLDMQYYKVIERII